MAKTPAELNALTIAVVTGMNLRYRETVANKSTWRSKYTFPKRANKRIFTLRWLYDTLRLEESAGIGQPPTYTDVYGDYTTVMLKEYEAAVKLSIYDTSEDDTGEILAQAQEIGVAAARFPEEQIIDALNNGDTSAYTMYDDEFLFSSGHTRNGNTYDNLLALALNAANLQAARTAMARFPTDKNEPSNLEATDLIVPPELQYMAMSLINSTLVNEATKYTENVLRGIMAFESDARLTDVDDWFVVHTGTGMTHKPYVHLAHEDFSPFRPIPEVDPNSDAFKIFREYRWWGRTLERVWPTHPFLQIKSLTP